VQEELAPKAASAKSNELDEVRAPVGNVKPENVIEEDGSVRIFWLDQMELDGVVHLVGKVLDRNTGRYVSACVSVGGIKRNLFVKPRAKRVRKWGAVGCGGVPGLTRQTMASRRTSK
jgi:DNA polymerase alpha subunit A